MPDRAETVLLWASAFALAYVAGLAFFDAALPRLCRWNAMCVVGANLLDAKSRNGEAELRTRTEAENPCHERGVVEVLANKPGEKENAGETATDSANS